MKRLLPFIVVLVMALAAYVAVYRLMGNRPGRTGLVQASGHVEGERTVVAARAPGLLAELVAVEGDRVARGDMLARLQESRAGDRLERSQQLLGSLEARLRSEQAGLGVLQAKVPLAIRAAEANVNLTLAVLQQCEAAEDQYRQEVERLRAIEEPDDEVLAQIDDLELAHEQARQDVVVAQAAVEHAESDLELARLGEDEIVARIAEVDALRAERDVAAVAMNAVQGSAGNMTILAPASGVITERRAVVGDEVEPGAVLYELVTQDALSVVVFVPQREFGAIGVGQAARIYLENAPDVPVDARVANVTTRGEGAGMLWSVRLVPITAPERPMVLGMRADVMIRVRDEAPWRAPRR